MIWALLCGVAIGSLPTALLLSRMRGIDLLQQGSANPGANNALQLGGKGLAAAVLVTEVTKGFCAVWLGLALAGDAGGALAGGGATLGNVYNPWLRFRGGKGLAITGGTLLAAWPAMLAALLAVIALGVALLRRSGPASLIALAVYVFVATLGLAVSLPGRWLVEGPPALLTMALMSSAVMAPKHLADTLRPAGRPSLPA